MPEPVVAALHRFPVKGLSPEPLDAVRLEAGAYFPGDRLFAIENGPSGFDEDRPTHLPKTRFLMLQRDERLALLRTAYSDEGRRLRIRLDGALLCDVGLDDDADRARLEAAVAAFTGGARGAPKLLRAQGRFSFTDAAEGFVSLINLASLRAVADAVGRPVDPLRLRANIAIEGLEGWVENGLVGHRLRVGGALLEVVSLTERCAATSVDPSTGARDMNLVKTLVTRFGHNVCGVYASVVEGGTVRAGDPVAVEPV